MMSSSFVRVPHLAIDDSALTAHALSVLVALANTPTAEGADGWVRISVAAFAARCGWAADSDCATRRRVSRALANALEQGFLERRWVTLAKYRAPEYRLTQRWTEALGFEPLPRCHLERLTRWAGRVRWSV
ncbi:hypothetical protein ACQCX5_06950 [Propionibacteriaceae bacterium G57]|uniref:hypothetical protein n=1 Tax=Aestuariimicrobium sp. G57 TaxID=3418485 RepID=UPI003DA75A72